MVFSGPENCIPSPRPPKTPRLLSLFSPSPPFSTTTPPLFPPHQTKNHQNRIVAESNASRKTHHSIARIQSICFLRSDWREAAHASAFSSSKTVGCGVLGAWRNPGPADCCDREAIRTSRPSARAWRSEFPTVPAPLSSARQADFDAPALLIGRLNSSNPHWPITFKAIVSLRHTFASLTAQRYQQPTARLGVLPSPPPQTTIPSNHPMGVFF